MILCSLARTFSPLKKYTHSGCGYYAQDAHSNLTADLSWAANTAMC